MSDNIDRAREGIEQAHHAGATHGDHMARMVAVMIAVLAALLAIGEMGEKMSQNAYLTHHISLSDDYNFYQAKKMRATMLTVGADILAGLPGTAADPQAAARIAAMKRQIGKLESDPAGGEGQKQLLAKARVQAELRDRELHRYHLFEVVVGALQIAIVLASVSVVTRMRNLALGAGAIGAAATLLGLLTASGAI